MFHIRKIMITMSTLVELTTLNKGNEIEFLQFTLDNFSNFARHIVHTVPRSDWKSETFANVKILTHPELVPYSRENLPESAE